MRFRDGLESYRGVSRVFILEPSSDQEPAGGHVSIHRENRDPSKIGRRPATCRVCAV